jgi:hypothetical protein
MLDFELTEPLTVDNGLEGAGGAVHSRQRRGPGEAGPSIGGSMAMWTLAAAAVALLHALYLCFQTFGALLGLHDRRWIMPHLVAVAWGVTIIAIAGSCPLTLLEKSLIAEADRVPYSESFLDHYLFGTLLPDGTQAWVYALHLVVIVLTYVLVVRRRRGHAGPLDSAAGGTAGRA